MNGVLGYRLLWSDRVMEAVLTTTDARSGRLDVWTRFLIGRHGRDVIGRFARR